VIFNDYLCLLNPKAGLQERGAWLSGTEKCFCFMAGTKINLFPTGAFLLAKCYGGLCSGNRKILLFCRRAKILCKALLSNLFKWNIDLDWMNWIDSYYST
jgi:hypothetical protein